MQTSTHQLTCNVVVLRGSLTADAESKDLSNGTRVAQLDIRTRNASGQARTVPVVIHKPSSAVEKLRTGADVVVTGQVQRRFFRYGGQTQSRTEVVADRVLPAQQTKRIETAIESAVTMMLSASTNGREPK
jgi:single-strand DNA-binding protein